MFTKIHIAFYDILFEIYGMRIKHYLKKMKEDDADQRKLDRKIRKCVDKREDILEIMFTLKGLI
jgi:hypothetical protein